MVRETVLLSLALLGAVQDPPATGPRTEKRFPPLKVPPGFKATLFACDPLVEYPSVMALGPRPGTIFIAHDYVTGLGFDIVRRSEIRLVEDTDGDGYADKSTVYAGGFNSIQGLCTHDGRVYAMHAPFLTVLRDTNGDGVADERKDLFQGLGWTPERAPDRLHGANGVVAGADGWLYLALGDRGCDGVRQEGDRLVHNGGGILRCRPDGSGLHVYATGLRNIYDIALDDELNVFVRDNENDGGTYMIRVCRSFFGADHGYPYLYEAHPDEGLKPLADLGRGSSAGIVCYLAEAFPPEYRGDLFCCEWGRSVVRYRRERQGASFAPMKEIEFAAGAPGDPYGFKPTDLVVDRDGSLLVSDWADDQRPKRGRGRVYRIAYEGKVEKRPGSDDPVAGFWKTARSGPEPFEQLFRIAEGTGDLRLRVQAIRAIADLADPVLVKHRLDAGPGDPSTAERLATLARGQDPRILFEAIVGLGRLRWTGAPAWMRETPIPSDPLFSHAVQQTLRRSGNWPAVLEWLDDAERRPIALHALAEQADPEVVDGLLKRLEASKDREIAELLARVHRKPGPWTYWGFRPGPRPANPVAWERTGAIETALAKWLKTERDAKAVAGTLAALRTPPIAPEAAEAAEAIARDETHLAANRLAALGFLDPGRLAAVAASLEDGAVLADAIRRLPAAGRDLVREKLKSTSPDVRLAAVETWGKIGTPEAAPLLGLLGDADPAVRAAAAAACGSLGVKETADALLRLSEDPDLPVRRRSLEALGRLHEPRALRSALKALDREPEIALPYVAEIGGPDQAEAVAQTAMRSRSLEILQTAVQALAKWNQPAAVARVQGAAGVVLQWTPDGKGGFAAELAVAEPFRAQFLGSTNGTMTVRLNGATAYQRPAAGKFVADSDRFDADLKEGTNAVVVEVAGAEAPQVQLRFRRKSAVERHERLAQLALTTQGSASRGRELFLNADKTGCVKCHRIGEQGGRIGPDLTGVGRRFSRIHLVESVLEPSRAIAPAYKNWAFRLSDGQVVTGVRVLETDAAITVGDAQGQTRTIEKSKIDAQKALDLSLMPEGLEKALSDKEFVDLIAFLADQK